MASHNTDMDVPLPVSLLLEQEKDEECSVFLEYDIFTTSDEYTTGKLVTASKITSAEYTISDEFSIPCKNIRNLTYDTSEGSRIKLRDCDTEDLELLFDMVSIAYTFEGEAAEIGEN